MRLIYLETTEPIGNKYSLRLETSLRRILTPIGYYSLLIHAFLLVSRKSNHFLCWYIMYKQVAFDENQKKKNCECHTCSNCVIADLLWDFF